MTDHQPPKTAETSEPLIAKQEQYGKSMKTWTSCMIMSNPQGDTQGPYIFRAKTKKEVHFLSRKYNNELFASTIKVQCHPPYIFFLSLVRLLQRSKLLPTLQFFMVIVLLSKRLCQIAPSLGTMRIWITSRAQPQVNSWLNVLSSSSLSTTKSGWLWIKPKDEKRWLSLNRGQLKMFLTEVCTTTWGRVDNNK